MNLADTVRNLFFDSLFRPEELPANGGAPDGAVLVDGLAQKFGFHPARLEAHRTEILEILSQMPESFYKSKGGGMSFLELCMDKNGIHWAEHPTMEMLVALAIGLKLAEYCAAREMWAILPGGVPYIVFDL